MEIFWRSPWLNYISKKSGKVRHRNFSKVIFVFYKQLTNKNIISMLLQEKEPIKIVPRSFT